MLTDMAWPQSICINICLIVWMKQTGSSTVEYRRHSRWISQAENSPATMLLAKLNLQKQSYTYDGDLLGAQTIAILSAIMI